MALVFLLVLSVFILVVGILGISLLFFLKNRKLKNVVFYFLVIWSMLIACLNATSLPTNYIGQQIIAWLFGSISIIAIIIKVKKIRGNKYSLYICNNFSFTWNIYDVFLIS
ncbi:hypothetical protein ACV3P7_00220 [Clostridium perfringens]|uniref:hypothetical protein n=1 Tax=Clostridium perfringens TaxID=1502 RepID=UPI0024BCF5BA|nr:hypothetical protein [Clostridium perfringens]